MKMKDREQKSAGARLLLFSAVSAFLVLLFCTKSSPLYPFNDWVDANCFFTVGKALLRGEVLYRDIAEQKGLLLYLLHASASLISPNSFAGVFVLEAAAGTFSVYWAARLLMLFAGGPAAFLSPAVFALLCVSGSFAHGDSAEELCLPLLLCSLYLGSRALEEDRQLSRGELFSAGALAACVFWIKFSIDTFFVGFGLVLFLRRLRRQGFGRASAAAGAAAAGFLLASLPAVAYFAVNGALGDLAEMYFYDNIFRYSGRIAAGTGFLSACLTAVRYALNRCLPALVLIAAGGVFLVLRAPKSVRLLWLLSFAAAAVPSVAVGQKYPYYYLILGVFAVPGAAGAAVLAGEAARRLRRGARDLSARAAALLLAGSLVFSVSVACFFSENRSFRSVKREELPQFIFAQIISATPNATLLNYGFLDGGFYTAAGIVPAYKYFCLLNGDLPGMQAAQDACVAAADPDYIVTRGKELQSDQYRLVSAADWHFEGRTFVCRLYERVSLLTGS